MDNREKEDGVTVMEMKPVYCWAIVGNDGKFRFMSRLSRGLTTLRKADERIAKIVIHEVRKKGKR